MDAKLKGKTVLVTGASGNMGEPVAVELAKDNLVYGSARFSHAGQKQALEEAGVRTIQFDLLDHDLSPLPAKVDVVFHIGAIVSPLADDPAFRETVFDINVGATGRLASRYRDAEAFVYASTGSTYTYQGERPLTESDKRGLHTGSEMYASTKIGGEALVRFLSEEWNLPATILRIFSLYGPRGGAPTNRIDRVAKGLPVSVVPGVRNVYCPMYEDDYVEKTIASASIASVPAEIINFAGDEPMTIQEYCEIAGEMLGKTPVFEPISKSYPIWPDTTKMKSLLGPCKVSMREGVRRVIESGTQARVHVRTPR